MLFEWLRRNQNVVVPLGLFLASLIWLSYQSYDKRNQQMSVFSGLVVDVAGLGQSSVTGVIDGVGDVSRHYLWLVGVEVENRELLREVMDLRRDNRELKEQAIENERLRRLLHFKPREQIHDWIPAQVVGESAPAGFNKTITIDKGSQDGIKPRMAVITYDSALVGQILDEPGSAIGFHSSQVLLITDRRSRVNVIVQRPESRAKRILAGRPESNTCDLLYAERMDDIRVGDLLITSGFGRVFMKGWPVGVIREIIRDSTLLYPRISVDPIADFSKLEEVIVIVPLEESQ